MTLTLTRCTYAYGLRARPVLENLTYTLPDGLTVLLGPNGAGKTTLLRLAAGVTRPRHGSVELDGSDSHHKAFRAAVAWMPQQITAMAGLTAREQVAYTGWLKGMKKRDAWDAAARALARVDLTDRADTRTKQLSGGQLRRVGVASALVHSARVLLLDEPTADMDPHQRRVFRDTLTSLTGDVRVLLSTHDIADLAEESQHVTVLHSGHITYTGTTADFLAHAPADAAPGRIAEAAYTALGTHPARDRPQQQ
ncbi:ATP-binding cassette domain-containing protein [Streptomyces tubbatahanensis]|uniref:ATP-binding cassette domain-containing protein n=1 Tax=Streptomyces tubbatahanensis TaxID=2923272 RepID=A0ABY3XKY6_9ACTN|nr:ATP-binding cassette domain-containing protein [Streptomyces tubbatahanensis]UNS95086.1 ATP-binding cassette domain-containing protein [Streptomyces tubbatahanensis]